MKLYVDLVMGFRLLMFDEALKYHLHRLAAINVQMLLTIFPNLDLRHCYSDRLTNGMGWMGRTVARNLHIAVPWKLVKLIQSIECSHQCFVNCSQNHHGTHRTRHFDRMFDVYDDGYCEVNPKFHLTQIRRTKMS